MLNIDSEKMLIELTRGDTANIVFSAKTEEGEDYEPVANDKLKFAVAKKVGAEPLFEIENEMTDDAERFWNIEIKPEHTEALKFADFVFDVQLETADGQVDTIIGKTDTLSPTFRVWGEVATESDE